MKRDLINLNDLTAEELLEIIEKSIEIKSNPNKFSNALRQKTLLMIFEKPSLRTRVSFETGMTKLGGHAIYLDVKSTPLGMGETIHDTAMCTSRYVDIIMARLLKQADTIELAKHSSVPVIDALSEMAHPCQAIADLMTIKEKKGKFKGLKMAYFGDAENNVTYSLMHACAMVGMHMVIACPQGEEYQPKKKIVDEATGIAKKTGSKISIIHNPEDAIKNADIVVTDTWMSYHIPPEKKEERIKIFKPYQVTEELMKKANKDAIFMHCLSCRRGYEMTADVVDGPLSVVFDEAENRMWTEMAIMLFLLDRSK
jgi:ornithine carbamoyltransferase